MKVGVISDIHENFHNLILALQAMEKNGVKQIICLGDLINAGIAKVLAFQSTPVFMIWGNNDGEKVDIMKASARAGSQLKVSLNVYDFLEIDNRKIFISHYDDLAQPMAQSGLYDAVFYGHNHISKQEMVNDTLVVNPGEICAQKSGKSTLAIYDTDSNTAEIITLENIITLKSDLVSAYLRDNMDKLGFRSKDSFNHL